MLDLSMEVDWRSLRQSAFDIVIGSFATFRFPHRYSHPDRKPLQQRLTSSLP